MPRRIPTLAAAVLALTLTACGDDPQSITDLNPDFTVTEEAVDGGTVLVVGTTSAGFSPYMDVVDLGVDMERIGRFIAAHPDKHPGVTSVRLEVTTPTQNRLGHAGKTRSMNLVMDRTTIAKINYENMTTWGMLNLTTPTVLHPVGRQLIAGYCEDDTAMEYSPDFCLAVLLSPR
ncbi:hypothetical protein [Roseospira visakhapatnamensis]|uniref:Uncharacterized protein n=1 Tax=Roseospira visakhapatnamensis TaxID=390880 RepID=A0A7W6RE44_9PROT|nr:hypothetical protein [Roseospira visakhapatnamensis]MBB4266875.1 hypothetical protein [Roseospira visakhapatnamensis]